MTHKMIMGALSAALALTATAGLAEASSGVTAAPCPSGSSSYSVKLDSKRHRVTHVAKLKVPARSTGEYNEDIPLHRYFTARANGNGEFSADEVLQKAYRKFMPKVDAEHIALPGDTTSVEASDQGDASFKNPSRRTQKYALYAARRVYTGTWKLTNCGDDKPSAKGTWLSFDSIEVGGGALCPSSRYSKSNPGREACRLAWS